MFKISDCFCLIENYAKNFPFCINSDNNIAQVPKQTDSNPSEPETSIDELLGLQVWVRVCVCLCVCSTYIHS